MLYPDPTQRTVLGWQIRWVAGLVALLMVAAGAIPAYSADASDPLLDARNGALYPAAAEEQATSGDLCAVTGELLGSKSGSESQSEVERDDLDSAWAATFVRIACLRLPIFVPQRASRSPGSTEAASRLAPRAPPLA